MPLEPGPASHDAPKYSLPELERRWLVDLSRVGPLEALPYRDIEDVYLEGTRLRLRVMRGPDGAVFKLCKKYGRMPDGGEPITNIYLTEDEYRNLRVLPGRVARKRRYLVSGGALDVYDSGEVFFEVEFASPSDMHRYDPPPFAAREVTGDDACSGAALAKPLSAG